MSPIPMGRPEGRPEGRPGGRIFHVALARSDKAMQ